jgi:hypothetical protein
MFWARRRTNLFNLQPEKYFNCKIIMAQPSPLSALCTGYEVAYAAMTICVGNQLEVAIVTLAVTARD